MFERIIKLAVTHRWLVMAAVIAMAALGIYNYQRLPIDAVPDITNVQVQVNTSAPGFTPRIWMLARLVASISGWPNCRARAASARIWSLVTRPPGSLMRQMPPSSDGTMR